MMWWPHHHLGPLGPHESHPGVLLLKLLLLHL
jgi:hypothetical protein